MPSILPNTTGHTNAHFATRIRKSAKFARTREIPAGSATAAEANWRLLMEPVAATNYGIIEAACFVGEHRGGRPGPWAGDVYTGVSRAGVCMAARDHQGAAEKERDDARDDDLEVNTQAPDQSPDASDVRVGVPRPQQQRVCCRARLRLGEP